MTTLGSFTPTADGGYVGTIRTLTLSAKSVRVQPIEAKAKRAPHFRITAAEVDLGAAWRETPEGKPPYLSVKLDDPSFVHPIQAFLVEADDTHQLVWKRRKTPA